jgi:uncharacterized membrane protein YbhN (UPF0104 family)
MRKKLQALTTLAILLLTVTIFVKYLRGHAAILQQLGHLSPALLIVLLLLYCCFSASLVALSVFSVEFCGHKLSLKENIIVYSYSALVNFFGPLQSGPGMRALYLKKRHGVRLRDYTLASLFYYAFYALFSGFMLITAAGRYLLPAVLALLLGIGCGMLLIRRVMQRKPYVKELVQHHLPSIGKIALAALAQMIFTTFIYFVELRAIDHHITFGQAITYTGAANFALFVSLTPGAIGIRESFLVFSQQLHHIGNSTIVAASLIDRAVYIVMLGILFVIVLALHARARFAVTN